jgi:hypothetical protein
MHYVARRDEHAEQAFLATRKFNADGTRVVFSQEDHDALHLLDRADRFLPNGYCLLPPLQSCEKGLSRHECGCCASMKGLRSGSGRRIRDTPGVRRCGYRLRTV